MKRIDHESEWVLLGLGGAAALLVCAAMAFGALLGLVIWSFP